MEKRTSTKRSQGLILEKLEPTDEATGKEINLLHIRVLGSQSDVNVQDCAKVSNNEIYYVLNPEGIVIGYVVLQVEDDTAVILALGVDDRLREKGIGKMLVQPILSNNKVVRLAVHQANKDAIRFYHKMGFMPEAALVNYYGEEQHGFSMVYSK